MGHGFIQAGDREVFFHRADLRGIKFNDLVVGDAVSFELIEDSVSGPRAIHVRGPA
jgi:cold shock CspA family protein